MQYLRSHGPQASHLGAGFRVLVFGAMLSFALVIRVTSALNDTILPSGSHVVSGEATVDRSDGEMTVTQGSQKAIINWNSFSIGQNNSITFVQPSQSSAVLNRVTSDAPSTLAGALRANGQVYLINPNGIAITSSGTVKVGGGFVASTLALRNEDFLRGDLNFHGTRASAGIRNQGLISTEPGGYVALLGGTVRNDGWISAPLGKIGLGSGEQAVLDLSGDGFLQVAVPTENETENALIESGGILSANGGSVIMKAATARKAARKAINLSGVVEANSISGKDGAIVIGGGEGGSVHLSGKVRSTSSSGKGGSIRITAARIDLVGAELDASGTDGGGTVLIGGEKHGAGGLRTATSTRVDKRSIIRADATRDGDGGQVVVWSDEQTRFAGSISARGAGDGKGGDVEVSGKQWLSYTGFTDLSAKNGLFGTLLLDPYNITISDALAYNASGTMATGDDSVINVTTLTDALAAANVEITTNSGGSQEGNITIASPLVWSANTTLTLTAANDILVNDDVTASGNSAGLVLSYGGDYAIASDASITLSGASAALAINGEDYTLIHSMAELDDIDNTGLSGSYALAEDLDASGTTYTEALAGLGSGKKTAFSGILAGLGHTISNLTIENPSASGSYYGLIGYNKGTIRDISIENGNLNISASDDVNAGLLVGYDYKGMISSSGASGNVSVSAAGKDVNAGGLVGYGDNDTIRNVSSIVDVTASGSTVYAGGISGENDGGDLTDTHASGTVLVTQASTLAFAGGLTGYNVGTIRNSDASGPVTVSDSLTAYAGGLAGYVSSRGTIISSFAQGDTTAAGTTAYIGGLVGMGAGGDITNTHATGIVRTTGTVADAYVGGLIGYNVNTIDTAYATGDVTASGTNVYTGGLIGMGNGGDILDAYADGNVTVTEGDFVYIGGLAGYISNKDYITAVHALGAVEATGTTIHAGGLVGYASERNTTTTSFAMGDVIAYASSVYAGGLLGYDNGSSTSISYASGNVTATGQSVYAGGLLGYNNGGTIGNTYARGSVTATGDSLAEAGGLVGWHGNRGGINASYATGITTATATTTYTGGLVGYVDNADIASTYFDSDTTGLSQGVGNDPGAEGVGGLTTAEFQNTNDFISRTDGAGGDFRETWAPPSPGHYPELYALTPVIRIDAGIVTASYGDPVSANFDIDATYGGPSIYIYGPAGDSLTFSPTLTTEATGTPDAGTYDIYGTDTTATSAGGIDYRVVYTGTYAVDMAELIITAGNVTKTYGDIATLAYTTAGLIGDDTVTDVSLHSFGTAATADVGFYDILADSVTGTGLSNYVINYDMGRMRVTKAALTISADDISKTYGETANLTYTASGLVNDDAVSAVNLASTGRIATANVGAYDITASNATGTGLSNYTISYDAGTLTVNPASLTIRPDNISKVYGNTAVLTDYAVSGLVNDDAVSAVNLASTGRIATANVGAYDITASNATGTGLSNYTISYDAGTLTVNPASLTIRPDNVSKVYGNTAVLTDYAVSGLVNDDAVSAVNLASVGIPASAPVGSYDIIASNIVGTGLSNYDVAYMAGRLTVRLPTARDVWATVTVSSNGLLSTMGHTQMSLGMGGVPKLQNSQTPSVFAPSGDGGNGEGEKDKEDTEDQAGQTTATEDAQLSGAVCFSGTNHAVACGGQ